MNLKDAFRWQNKLQSFLDEANGILSDEDNVTRVQKTYLRKKVMAEAENETVLESPATEFAGHITEMTGFLLYLLEEKGRLSAAIREAKTRLPIDLDSETGLNACRQTAARTLHRMALLRSEEVVQPNGGYGYRFNNDGDQVAYKCDVKRVTTIDFNRNAVRSRAAALDRRAEEVSAALDKCVVNGTVEYEAPFGGSDSFAEAFETYRQGG